MPVLSFSLILSKLLLKLPSPIKGKIAGTKSEMGLYNNELSICFSGRKDVFSLMVFRITKIMLRNSTDFNTLKTEPMSLLKKPNEIAFKNLSIILPDRWMSRTMTTKVMINDIKPVYWPVMSNHSYNLAAVKDEKRMDPQIPKINAAKETISLIKPFLKPVIKDITKIHRIITSIQFIFIIGKDTD